ncbi:hypothetical protein [Hyphococcus sp.]|uniref:hypothetical protein n=1 Tax=Hyphococcus sp. TaxID=2038636 RepID=UPI003CCBCFF4
MPKPERSLLAAAPNVINIGLELFADALEDQSAEVAHVAWQPPVQLEDDLKDILDDLL